jgi:hypothetical protein
MYFLIKTHPVEAELFHGGGLTDVTVDFCNSANAPKKKLFSTKNKEQL